MSLSRNFRIRERGTLTFRAEAFNMTNSVVLGGVTTGVTSANFGRLVPVAQSTAAGNNHDGASDAIRAQVRILGCRNK